MKIGVLALQGDFHAHKKRLEDFKTTVVEVRYAHQFKDLEGLILPGGESTANLILLDREKLWETLLDFAATKPILGTCAGAILLASEVLNPPQPSLSAIEMTIERNAYGRQVDSSIRKIKPEPAFIERTKPGSLEAVFIRAPIIRQVGVDVNVLLRDDEHPILVEQGLHLAATFHAELTTDRRLHKLFLQKVRNH